MTGLEKETRLPRLNRAVRLAGPAENCQILNTPHKSM